MADTVLDTQYNDATTGTGAGQFEFVGTWSTGVDSGALNNDEHYSNTTDSYYQVRFTGTQARLYTTKGDAYGIAAVSVNGGSETLIDLYNVIRTHQILVYSTPVLASATHTLKVRVTGTKNASALSAYVVADRVDVVVPMISTGDGWMTALHTDFTSGALPAPWHSSQFANAVEPAGYYLTSHVVVTGGVCQIIHGYEASGPGSTASFGGSGQGWYQGRLYVQDGPWSSIDHRVTQRMRVVTTGGVYSHRNMPLWWPVSEDWLLEGEEDFFESDGVDWPPVGGAEEPRVFLHYPPDNTFTYQIYPRVDVSAWHVYRLQRLEHRLTVWIDDMNTPVIDHQYTATELPDTVKYPVWQQENPSYEPPAGTTGGEVIELDYVTIDIPDTNTSSSYQLVSPKVYR